MKQEEGIYSRYRYLGPEMKIRCPEPSKKYVVVKEGDEVLVEMSIVKGKIISVRKLDTDIRVRPVYVIPEYLETIPERERIYFNEDKRLSNIEKLNRLCKLSNMTAIAGNEDGQPKISIFHTDTGTEVFSVSEKDLDEAYKDAYDQLLFCIKAEGGKKFGNDVLDVKPDDFARLVNAKNFYNTNPGLASSFKNAWMEENHQEEGNVKSYWYTSQYSINVLTGDSSRMVTRGDVVKGVKEDKGFVKLLSVEGSAITGNVVIGDERLREVDTNHAYFSLD